MNLINKIKRWYKLIFRNIKSEKIEIYEHISELPIINFFEIKKENYQYLLKKPFWKISKDEVLPENFKQIIADFVYQMPLVNVKDELIRFKYLKYKFLFLTNPTVENQNEFQFYEKEIENMKVIDFSEGEKTNLDSTINKISVHFKMSIPNKFILSTLDFFNWLKLYENEANKKSNN